MTKYGVQDSLVSLVDVAFVVIIRMQNRMAEEVTQQVAHFVQTEGRGELVRLEDMVQVRFAGLDVLFQLGPKRRVFEDLIPADVRILPRAHDDRPDQTENEPGQQERRVGESFGLHRLLLGGDAGPGDVGEGVAYHRDVGSNNIRRKLHQEEHELEDVDAEGICDRHGSGYRLAVYLVIVISPQLLRSSL